MTGHLLDLFGTGYRLGLAEIAFVSVIGAAILYSKHGIGTFGLCVIAAIAGYSGSWFMFDLWGDSPSLLVCELMGGFFGVAVANVWLRLREAQVDGILTSGEPARPAVGK
ncbi:MAG TPA: hypothetical protein VML55_17775 [Planctomycetaceae bacterium]|nr:hypothetical protein [Planctomycetaceae bacterium]